MQGAVFDCRCSACEVDSATKFIVINRSLVPLLSPTRSVSRIVVVQDVSEEVSVDDFLSLCHLLTEGGLGIHATAVSYDFSLPGTPNQAQCLIRLNTI